MSTRPSVYELKLCIKLDLGNPGQIDLEGVCG